MRSFSAVAVLSCLVLAYAGELPAQYAEYKRIRDTPGEGYKLYTHLADSVTLSDGDKKDTFDGLDASDNNRKVTEEELKNDLYWYDELSFARKKILKTLDKSNDNTLTEPEVTAVLNNREYKLALVECHYLKAETLREFCLADQLLTYIALVIDQAAIDKFFDEVDTSNDNKITKEEVESLPKLTDVDNFLEELGGHDGDISPKEFKEYLIQESIGDDFRRCRRQVDANTGAGTYDVTCLKEELVEYTQDDLTELDIAMLYRFADIDGKDGITHDEIKKIPGVEIRLSLHVYFLLDLSVIKDGKIDYGEFRSYVKSPTVQLQLERLCTETKKTQKEELDCLQEEFVKLLNRVHTPIWLTAPDLDQLIAFEKIETSDNGIIEPRDIEWGQAEINFFSELDHDQTGYICLEEFNEYADIPHMVYGMEDCMLANKGGERASCYEGEVKKIMTNILPRNIIGKWFDIYEKAENGDINDLKKFDDSYDYNKRRKQKIFIFKLAQGSETIPLFDFSWFVKQQELAETYGALGCTTKYAKISASTSSVTTPGNTDPGVLQEKLETYIDDHLTEFDTQELFENLDTSGHREVVFPGVQEWKKTIPRIYNKGEEDRDEILNFVEFWLWLHSPYDGTVVKAVFEEECTKKNDTQDEEIACYVKIINEGRFTKK